VAIALTKQLQGPAQFAAKTARAAIESILEITSRFQRDLAKPENTQTPLYSACYAT
jgi:hypothetical protein